VRDTFGGGDERGLDGLCILVVDDKETNAIALGHALEAVGAQARTAFTAANAIRAATLERFDVFICDLVMPDMDGCRMLGELRATSLNARTPAIAHTGYSGEEIERAAAAAGYDRVMTKPVGLQSFVTAIRALCAITRALPPAA
jgi:CheY-like chemotaxis protein